MSLIELNLLTRSAPPPDSDFWYGAPERNDLSKYLTDDGALALSVVDACYSLIADSIGQLPMMTYRRKNDDERELSRKHPVFRRTNQAPNSLMTAAEFWARMAHDMLSRGDGFAELAWGGGDEARLAAMYPLNPVLMEVKWLAGQEGRVRRYLYRDTASSEPRMIQPEDLLHIPGRGFDGLRGRSLVALHPSVIKLTAAAEEYVVRYFEQGATAPHYVSYPGQLSPDSRNKAKEWLAMHFGGLRNAHKLGVLEGGGKIETLPINHRDMQLSELRKFQIEEFCRVCRIPPDMISSADSGTNVGKSVEQRQIAFKQFTLGPYLRVIEQRCNETLFGPRERERYYVEFSVDDFIRGDMAAQADYFKNATGGAGWMTVNEVRHRKNAAPIAGGDEVFVQGAMVPLHKAGLMMGVTSDE